MGPNHGFGGELHAPVVYMCEYSQTNRTDCGTLHLSFTVS